MLFSRLADKLKRKYPETGSVILDDSLVKKLQFLGDEESFLPDTLYVVYGERAITKTVFPHNMIIFFRNDQERATLTDHFTKTRGPANMIYASWEHHEKIMNDIQDYMLRDQNRGESYSEFLRMVIEGKDLYYLLSEGAKRCGRWLVALDISGKIQGYSPVQNYLTEDWIKAIKNGYCPVDFMEHLRERLLTRTEITSTPFIYLCDQTKLTYLSSPVIVDGSPYGYVFLLSEKDDCDPVAYDILPVLSKVMGDYLRRSNQGVSSRNHIFHELVRDILHGESSGSVQSRIASGKLPIPPLMRVLVVHFYYAEREREALKKLSSQLALFFGPFAPLHLENRLILLQNMDPKLAQQNEKAMVFLRQLALSNRLYIGISNEFIKLESFAEYYEEAETALRLAARLHIESNLVYFRDFAFYSMLCKIPSSEKLRSFCHPALRVLQRYDAENHTELLETLRVYISTNCNQKLTSELMFAHRNTVSYRRQQIIDLTGIDFLDPDTLFQLEYSFKIYQFMDS